MAVAEVGFREALEFAKRHNTKLVWLGTEPVEYVRRLLKLDSSQMISADPGEIIRSDRKAASRFKDHVFVCYHGNTSRSVANAVKEKFGIDSLSMKGGVTAVVGEIF